MNKITLSIVIPCLNEKETIVRSVRSAKKYADKYFPNKNEIVVADNGSTDGTLELICNIDYVRVVHVPVRGYGAALHYGILSSLGKYTLFADADLSYPFSNLKQFESVMDINPDLVLGSRIKGKIAPNAMPPLHRYIGTPLLTLLIRLLYRIPVSDCNSGMRLVKNSFYSNLNMKHSGMEWASELLLKTAINKGKYTEVPIDFHKDKRNRPPYLSTWADGWRHLKTIILIKPSSLYIFLLFFPLLAVYFYRYSFGMTFLFLLLTEILIYSLLSLNLLEHAIDGKKTSISIFLSQFKLVPLTLIILILIGIYIFIIPDDRLGTKLFLISSISITMMWIFLVETIKTHLINRLD